MTIYSLSRPTGVSVCVTSGIDRITFPNSNPSLDLTAENVEQLGGDGLLTELVVFELKLIKQLLRIVVGALHRHDTRGLLGGLVFGKRFLHHGKHEERQYRGEDGVGIGLENVGPTLHGDGVVGQCFLSHGEQLLGAKNLTTHALVAHVDYFEQVDIAVEILLLQGEGEVANLLPRAFGVDLDKLSNLDVGA